jgi:hypothetical protein
MSNIVESEVITMNEQHHFLLGETHALHVYLENGKYNGHIMVFPEYQQGTYIRNGSHLCDIPSLENVEEAKVWAKEYLGL